MLAIKLPSIITCLCVSFVAFSAGCDRQDRSSGDSSVLTTHLVDHPIEEPDTEKTVSCSTFAYNLPKDIDRSEVEGLDVVVKAENVESNEGYFIDFFALKEEPQCGTPIDKISRIPLGSTAVFKPLETGETDTAPLDPPPEEAWIETDRGRELFLTCEVRAGHRDREVPEVDLRIVLVSVSNAQ